MHTVCSEEMNEAMSEWDDECPTLTAWIGESVNV